MTEHGKLTDEELGIHPTHESMNRIPTMMGIPRNQFWFGAALCLQISLLSHSYIFGFVGFVSLWAVLYWAYKRDDKYPEIWWQTQGQPSVLDAFKY